MIIKIEGQVTRSEMISPVQAPSELAAKYNSIDFVPQLRYVYSNKKHFWEIFRGDNLDFVIVAKDTKARTFLQILQKCHETALEFPIVTKSKSFKGDVINNPDYSHFSCFAEIEIKTGDETFILAPDTATFVHLGVLAGVLELDEKGNVNNMSNDRLQEVAIKLTGAAIEIAFG